MTTKRKNETRGKPRKDKPAREVFRQSRRRRKRPTSVFTDFLFGSVPRAARHPTCKLSGTTDDTLLRDLTGGPMKKIVLLLAAAAIAASPALAQDAKKETKQETKQPRAAMTKHKKKMTKEEAEAADIAQQHDNTRRAMRDALPLVLPSWSMPIFFGMHMDEKLKEGDKKPKQ
jgi:hypothetical protein